MLGNVCVNGINGFPQRDFGFFLIKSNGFDLSLGVERNLLDSLGKLKRCVNFQPIEDEIKQSSNRLVRRSIRLTVESKSKNRPTIMQAKARLVISSRVVMGLVLPSGFDF